MVWGATALGVAFLAFAVYGRPALNGDVIHALIWGRDLGAGQLPAYSEGPTPHPLTNLIAAGLSALGPGGAYHASEVLALLFVGALVITVALLGRALFSLPVGILAAVLLATDYGTMWRAMAGFYDIPALALAAGALIAVLRRRRLVLPAVLLALAGLIRPEYWLYGGLLGLYALARGHGRDRLLAPAICASAPLLWIASDAAITGEPLWSLTHTQDLAAEIGRRTGLSEAPDAFVDHLRALTSRVVLVLGAIGAVLALAWRRASGVALVGVMGAGAFTYFVIGAADLSLIDRYLLPSAIALTLLSAYAALGWIDDRARTHRPPWAVVAAVAIAGLLATVPNRVHDVQAIRGDNERWTALIDDLRALSAEAGACRPVHVSYPRGMMKPTVAHALDLTPGGVPTFGQHGAEGSFIAPADGDTAKRVRGAPNAPILTQPGPGRMVERTGHWVFTRERCQPSAAD